MAGDKYVTIPNQSFLRFVLTCRQAVDDGNVTLDIGALTQLYNEAVTASGRSNRLFIEDGIVYVHGKAIGGFDSRFVELLETLLCRESMRLEEMFPFFTGIDPDKKTAKQALRNLLSRQNEHFGETGIAVLGDGSGNFKIFGLA